MDELDRLKQRISNTSLAPREQLVNYLKKAVEMAQRLPSNEREVRGDYTDQANRFPQTKGEIIASDILACILQQAWIDYDTEDDLEEIGELATSLETNTDDHVLWLELFEKINKLR